MQMNNAIWQYIELFLWRIFYQIINDNREMLLWTYKFTVCQYFVCLALARAVRNCICMYIDFINFISKIIVFEFCFFRTTFWCCVPVDSDRQGTRTMIWVKCSIFGV